MPRIRCHYTDCIFLDEGYCSAAAVEIDPDTGCATYSPVDGPAAEAEWEDEEELEEWEEEEVDEEDLWADDEEDEF
ncbi:MAG: hypothetical protein L6461_14800 [Anaerolineae bacterium]|nr:hypothetical protein [Anaerolineae bacterium]